jgi:uncharacterized protein (TIGR00369 family)
VNWRSQDKHKTIKRFNQAFGTGVPHNRALGLQLIDFDAPEPGRADAIIRVPYDPKFIGNPETGVLHGGVVTSLIDATASSAVFLALPQPMRIATLDLRIDYLKPASPNVDLIAKATCYKVTRMVAFARAMAFHESDHDPVASAAGTFMIFRDESNAKEEESESSA